MKIRNLALILALTFAAGSSAWAQSTPAAVSHHTGNAVTESALASAAAAGSGLKLASGAAAVPLWMVGSTSVAVGGAAHQVGAGLWDSATCTGKARPALDPKAGMPVFPPAPVAALTPAAPQRDPSPAEALKGAK